MEVVERSLAFTCGSGTVTLDVVVGEGHTGGISVYRNGTSIEQGVDELYGVTLGDCASLARVSITIRATVNVVHHQSGRTSLACTLHGAGDEDPYVIEGPEVGVGEPVMFKVTYTLEEEPQ